MSRPSLTSLAANARRIAKRGAYNGFIRTAAERSYMLLCTHYNFDEGFRVLFTRDQGMHSCGWWKNPDYNQCEHLSISFFEPMSELAVGVCELTPREFDRAAAKRIATEFFHENVRMFWIEPLFSPRGKELGVHHYRLFCDRSWSPIVPRGEVYSRDNTPAGWKSWSEIHGNDEGVRSDDGGHS